MAVTLVTLLAAAPVLIFPGYVPIEPTGDLPVATATREITDPARDDRWLALGMWYPNVSGGSFPLVVFSHGSMGVKDTNLSLFRELASHGHVVVSIAHTGHALYSRHGTGRRTWIDTEYLGELRREDATEDLEQSLAYYRKWMAVRVGDIGFVVDHVLGNAGGDAVFALVDRDRIGLVGHSLGGAAVYGAARIRDDIDAVVGLEAPFMTEIVDVEESEFVWNPDPYPVPVLNVYSDSAWGHLDEWPQYRRNREMLDDPTVLNVHLAGVGHLHLTDLSLSSPLLTRLLNGHPSRGDARAALTELNGHVLRFFDTHLGASTPQR